LKTVQHQYNTNEAGKKAERRKLARKQRSAKRLSAPMIKCKKTPREKCRFVAEEAKKR
jgi:hypothetical protein